MEGSDRVLEDHLDFSVEQAAILLLELRYILTLEADIATVTVDETADAASQGALAGAAFADDGDNFSGLKLEGQAVQG
jgi:hypothetical protein